MALAVLGLNLVGAGLRDLLDRRRSRETTGPIRSAMKGVRGP